MLSKDENLIPLGFLPEGDDNELLGQIDEFISKIATMLVSLLEGEKDTEIL